MLNARFFSNALTDNGAVLTVNAEAMIVKAFDGRAVISCRELELLEFAQLGHCRLEPVSEPRPEVYRYWGGEKDDGLHTQFEQVVWRVFWGEASMFVIHLSWDSSCGENSRNWVVAESTEEADAFILEVARKTHAPGNAILVFSNGHWSRSRSLYDATQSASFDDLVLADDLKAAIRSDFLQFLNSEDRYRRLGMAWRRGALLIGPPGNGKTHCLRALVKELGISSLYVSSLSHHYYTAEQMWQQVFERARGLSPCVLVIEDLDSIVKPENRSYFLNQLDGLEPNHGMIVIATTNHPDRIDPAIIDRPSRFDRKYHFELPLPQHRLEYLQIWQRQLAEETQWKPDEVSDIAESTEGFSYAYLKELVISAVMTWIQDSSKSFSALMAAQVDTLRRQMRTESIETSEGDS